MKPAEYGIKIWTLADAASTYTKDPQIYLDKEGNQPAKEMCGYHLTSYLPSGHSIMINI